MTIKEYISELDKQYQTGVAREHSYRHALQNFLATLLPALVVTNEPARRECGAPDFILQRGDSPIAFIEAKDIDDNDLRGSKRNKEQFDRYKRSLDNIIFTDYLDFHLYEKGEAVDSVRIGEVRGDKIVAIKDNEAKFLALIGRFGDAQPQRITSSARLAEIMAGKARLLAYVIEQTIEEGAADNTLNAQLDAFKDVLMNNITPKEFADVYAQTIAYGMFAARLHDKSPDTFSRQEASILIPRTNPFLRQLFQYVAGYDLDERVSWIVDDLAEAFRATDIAQVMSGFGQRTQQTDPMIHFYENFLSAYDPALRKSRGVWYTPQSVVNFIVRAVDEVLQKEFSLPMGLADTSKTTIKVANQKAKLKDADTYDIDVHRVQILDPATGTGTFLAEVVSQIYDKFKSQQGMWQGYVEEHLIPRLNGFELLMASYTMAHLKIDMLLNSTGYVHRKGDRLRVFLTNSLEEHHNEANKLGFYKWLADEGNEADRIKRDTPVMVVMGNPPYSGESRNKGEWILRLMDDYKREPDTNIKLQERNAKWLNDDYCKFIRLGQSFVDKNSEGVLAYINNHSFIDNPTFRGMRWNLMQSFDKIYIIDLHGNCDRKEVCPDGSKDENVFDIQQGVSINIFVKTGKKPKGTLAEVYHYDLWGKREDKYSYLLEHSLSNVPFNKLAPTSPEYFFVPQNNEEKEAYLQRFSVVELFPVNSVGIVTAKDKILVNERKETLLSNVSNYYNIKSDAKYITPILYRPFDIQYVYYDTNLVERSRAKVMQHFLKDANLGLVSTRFQFRKNMDYSCVYLTKSIIDINSLQSPGTISVLPLYLYTTYGQTSSDGTIRRPNLKPEIVAEIAKRLGLEFETEKSDNPANFAPIDLLDYIYAVLHSPTYRERYKEFLKIDFPRVPYPTDAAEFRRLAAIGAELRSLHLMEHPSLANPQIITFPVAGSGQIEKPRFEIAEGADTGRVWINADQYFDGVPRTAWEFYIGGYQPAQKWLKDRSSSDFTLSYDTITHYQRIITAITLTHKIMVEIDNVE